MAKTTIALTGDILPTQHLVKDGQRVYAASEPVFDILRAADVAVGNFEMPLTDGGEPVEKLLNIRANPAIAGDMNILGLDCVNIANNHMVDYGWDGIRDTIGGLRGAGIKTVGAGRNLDEAGDLVVFDVNGQRIGITAFSCLLPTGWSATQARAGLSPIHIHTSYEIDPYYQMEEPGDPSVVRVRTRIDDDDLKAAIDRIRAFKACADFLIVSVHWGFGSGEALADYQQPLGRALIDAGADIVYGHHPHAIHAAEIYHGKAILYSLGTLIGQQIFLDASDAVKQMWSEMSADGYVAVLTVDRTGNYSLQAVPTTMDCNRMPVVATGEAFEAIADRLIRLSAGHDTAVTSSNGHLVLKG